MFILHPSMTMEEVAANMEEVERSFGNAKLANNESNTQVTVDWLNTNAQHPDGRGVLPTVPVLKRCIAELRRANKLTWTIAPRTQQQIRLEEEAKKHPEMLSPAEVRRQTEDAMKAATIMAGLRGRTNTAGGDIRSHSLRLRIREGLEKFLNEFLLQNDITKNFTAAQAEAFQNQFNAEERRLFESKLAAPVAATQQAQQAPATKQPRFNWYSIGAGEIPLEGPDGSKPPADFLEKCSLAQIKDLVKRQERATKPWLTDHTDKGSPFRSSR